MATSREPVSPFVEHVSVHLSGNPEGPLAGRRFAVKDLFDVQGAVTGAGNPTWLASHEPASRNSPVVDQLLEAGADLIGKTQTDELAFSLNGENYHYGTPLNPACPDRIPGGSSSGSASAVAQKLVDFAMATDTAGSVRVPASYCGLWGVRTTLGAISVDCMVPLAPPFDTVGWLTRDADLLKSVGDALLPEDISDWSPRRLIISTDGFDKADDNVCDALMPALERLKSGSKEVECLKTAPAGTELNYWADYFRTMQGFAIWKAHGSWIEKNKPSFGPGISERFVWTSSIPEAQADIAFRKQAEFREHMTGLLGNSGLLVLPTTPGPAPFLETSPTELEHFRARLFTLTAIASFAGCPQVSMPVAALDGAPIGLSLVAPPGADRALLQFVEALGSR